MDAPGNSISRSALKASSMIIQRVLPWLVTRGPASTASAAYRLRRLPHGVTPLRLRAEPAVAAAAGRLCANGTFSYGVGLSAAGTLIIRAKARVVPRGEGGKMRFIPTHPGTLTLIEEYLEAAGHGPNPEAPLFRPVKNNVHGHTLTALTPDSIYFEVVLKYLRKLGIFGENMGPHVMRATAATNALDNGADIAKVQEWLGHANIATTRIYDHRKTRPEDSPTFKVSY